MSAPWDTDHDGRHADAAVANDGHDPESIDALIREHDESSLANDRSRIPISFLTLADLAEMPPPRSRRSGLSRRHSSTIA